MNNKIVVSVFLAGIFICDAFAIPNVADRKQLCESKPLDFVWVEKTLACVPINPCKSSDETILYGYCIPGTVTVESEKNAELATQRYVEKVLNTQISNIKNITSNDDNYLIYLGVRTVDNSYYVFPFYKPFGIPQADNLLAAACWAYGKKYVEQEPQENEYWCRVQNETECTDIADFASLLLGEMISGETENIGATLCRMKRTTTNQKEKK